MDRTSSAGGQASVARTNVNECRQGHHQSSPYLSPSTVVTGKRHRLRPHLSPSTVTGSAADLRRFLSQLDTSFRASMLHPDSLAVWFVLRSIRNMSTRKQLNIV